MAYPNNLYDTPYCRENDINIISDYIELCCLVHQDGLFSLDNLRNLFELSDQEGIEEDVKSKTLRESMECCVAKQNALQDRYPFEMVNKNVIKKKNLNLENFLYLQLLFSANLSYFNEIQSKLTSKFEVISKRAIGGLFSQKATVKIFGKGSAADPDYSGNVWQRLCSLANDIKLKITCKEEDFSRKSTGDLGIDIVAWHPFSDPAGCYPVLFGQCSCGINAWQDKQYSVSNQRLTGYISSRVPFYSITSTPSCFRGTQGDWLREAEISSLLLDRIRLLLLIEDENDLILPEVEDISKLQIDVLSL